MCDLVRNGGSLMLLQQFLDTPGICLGMTMTFQRIGSAGRFNQYISPDHSRLNMNRCNFRDADAHFIRTEKPPFTANHGFVADFDDSGKKPVAFSPATGFKNFSGHIFWGGRQF